MVNGSKLVASHNYLYVVLIHPFHKTPYKEDVAISSMVA